MKRSGIGSNGDKGKGITVKVKKDKRLACRNIDGYVYAVSPWDHKLHRLNKTGTQIWEFLEKGFSSRRIAREFSKSYDVPERQARADIDLFLEELSEKELLVKKPCRIQ